MTALPLLRLGTADCLPGWLAVELGRPPHERTSPTSRANLPVAVHLADKELLTCRVVTSPESDARSSRAGADGAATTGAGVCVTGSSMMVDGSSSASSASWAARWWQG
ncbi:hypothetical protein [Streptomyces sp. NPDC006971]|uniref:hypothetical protein n=1 Tax=Streptomyces sp. NPDC006971 TaxID=3154784 RepID=UPI0033DAC31A